LGYLTLDRPTHTLSGGEARRVRLSANLGSQLVGVCYVLDEPTVGLHMADVDKLTGALLELRASGNSVIVVEHDESLMRRADWIIDMGPGAGRLGGNVVARHPGRGQANHARSRERPCELARKPPTCGGRGTRALRLKGATGTTSSCRF
jgi:excinuclease ABC subunit A